ncbi:hypothetical protein CTAYLR_004843 [Chrysophaeum taylorii]|uniref:EF-hand domain-containing protein n=1 Tax=Chrysophaeum taylorii TaxID=2483200 RepID=A0AAD7UEY8_9STRA|nr:hypothetical protein CTAYLR_004843 [Chrysophaeum taylorii]
MGVEEQQAAAPEALPRIRVPIPAARDLRALKINFNDLRRSAGSYVLARRALRKAEDDQTSRRMRRLEAERRVDPQKRELANIVRMSTMIGGPSLCNIHEAFAKHKKNELLLDNKPPPPKQQQQIAAENKTLAPIVRQRAMTPEERERRTQILELAASRSRDAAARALVKEERRIREVFIAADQQSSGTIDRLQFRSALSSLGFVLETSKERPAGAIVLARATEEEWWDVATRSSHSPLAEIWDVTLVVKRVCDAFEANRASRERERESCERLAMLAEEAAEWEKREHHLMHAEDLRTNEALRARLFWGNKLPPPFDPVPRPLAPAPPPWRVDGATGRPCEPPALRACAATARSHRAFFTHAYVCNEEGIEDAPAALCLTLHLQLGLTSLRLPRNKLRAVSTPGFNPQLTCRTFKMLTELNCSRNQIAELPFDIGLCDKLARVDLQNNALHALPASFVRIESLVDLNLRHNNFSELPDDICSLKSLQTLNVADNLLVRVPSTLPRLYELRALHLSGNGLTSLAVLPPLYEVANTRVEGADAWQARVEPVSRHAYFVNLETRMIQRLLPAVLGRSRARRKAADKLEKEMEGEEEDKNNDDAEGVVAEVGSERYNRQRQRLAHRGVHEWSFEWSESENKNLYSNAVTGEIVALMPEALDTWAKLQKLTELRLDRNRLRDLPDGLTRLASLATLVARENYIRTLPENFGRLKKLKVLNVAENELSTLPESMSELSTTLELLVIQANRFEKLPAFLGRLGGLKKLRAGHNSLTTLPYELGFAESLEELQVYDNPLDADWYANINDLPKLKWQCRQKFWSIQNGVLPTVETTHVSICDEVVESTPAHKVRIDALVDSARSAGTLELQLQGVREIPGAVVERGKTRDKDEWFHPKLEGMHTLKLNMNAFETGVPLITKSLGRLRVLWLKECSLTRLDENVDHLQGLLELDLEGNQIYELPRTFTRLRRLERLNLAKNRLQALPADIGQCAALERLDLAMNRVERLPEESFTKLKNLTELSLASNALFTLPVLSPGLSKLTKLNVDANDLRALPARLGELPLASLRASHNRLEWLSPDIFGPRTTSTLEYLGIASNNLLELPSCVPGCSRLKSLQVEYNPLRNPPPELVSQGMAVLQQYCELRDARIEAFEQLLADYDLEFDSGHLAPEAYNVLTGRTGFLTPDDLAAFDKAVDAYLNGPYYTNPSTDVEIVERVDRVRHEREHVFYNAMLQALINVLRDQLDVKNNNNATTTTTGGGRGNNSYAQNNNNRLFGCGVLIETTRPWGRKGSEVGAYALSLDALVSPSGARQFVREPRPPLFELVKRRLPASIFDYTLEVLKDAITKYEGPYGTVAQLDKVEYERCECVDERGRTKGHAKCVLPSVVVVKTIYTVGEAQRRVQEEDAIRAAWVKTCEAIDGALETTKLGKLMARQEMFRRQRDQGHIIQSLRRVVQDKQKLVKRAVEYYQAAIHRKQSFEDGGAYHFHRLETNAEAQNLVASATAELEARKQELKDTERELSEVKALGKIKKELQLQRIALDLKQKYCVLEYEKIVDANRRRAFENEWRRPWDGDEGADYKAWYMKNTASLHAGLGPWTLPRWVAKLLPVQKEEDEDVGKEEVFDYDWVGTDNMDLFANDMYSAFEDEQ